MLVLTSRDVSEIFWRNIFRRVGKRIEHEYLRSIFSETVHEVAIPYGAMVVLNALTLYFRPQVIAEVGKGLGRSARSMVGKVVSCDRNFPADFPTSTEMLKSLEKVDFLFLDGRLQTGDLEEIERISHPDTLYAMDDFEGMEKGVSNSFLLSPLLPKHVLILPSDKYAGENSVAVFWNPGKIGFYRRG